MTVEFTSVGRDKRSWTKDYPELPSPFVLAKEAKRGGGLMSSDVQAVADETGVQGLIIVGGYRPVGGFTFKF